MTRVAKQKEDAWRRATSLKSPFAPIGTPIGKLGDDRPSVVSLCCVKCEFTDNKVIFVIALTNGGIVVKCLCGEKPQACIDCDGHKECLNHLVL